MKQMLTIIDKFLQGNLVVSVTTFALNRVGVLSVTNTISREDIVQTALLISAVTGAIYGLYRVGDLIYKGIREIKKCIKK